MRALLFAAAVMVAVPAYAQAPAADAAPSAAPAAATSLTLVNAADALSRRTIIDGATWTCAEGGVCTASGGAEQPATRACRRVVARVGAVSQFSWKGAALTSEQLATCNA
jgi:hypothetical protein